MASAEPTPGCVDPWAIHVPPTSVILDVIEFRRRFGVSTSRRPEHPGERLAGRDAPGRAPPWPLRCTLSWFHPVPPPQSIGKTSWSTRFAPGPPPEVTGLSEGLLWWRRVDELAIPLSTARAAVRQVRSRRRCPAPHLPRRNSRRRGGGSTRPAHLRSLGTTRPRPVQHHRPTATATATGSRARSPTSPPTPPDAPTPRRPITTRPLANRHSRGPDHPRASRSFAQAATRRPAGRHVHERSPHAKPSRRPRRSAHAPGMWWRDPRTAEAEVSSAGAEQRQRPTIARART